VQALARSSENGFSLTHAYPHGGGGEGHFDVRGQDGQVDHDLDVGCPSVASTPPQISIPELCSPLLGYGLVDVSDQDTSRCPEGRSSGFEGTACCGCRRRLGPTPIGPAHAESFPLVRVRIAVNHGIEHLAREGVEFDHRDFGLVAAAMMSQTGMLPSPTTASCEAGSGFDQRSLMSQQAHAISEEPKRHHVLAARRSPVGAELGDHPPG
jgi:hypothetical protein